MLTANGERQVSMLQNFAHSITRSFERSGMIHAAIIQCRARVYAGFDGTPVEFLVVQLHLARGSKNRLWPMFGAFQIANAVLQRGRNDGDACSGRVAIWCIRGTELGHKSVIHIVIKLLLFSSPFSQMYQGRTGLIKTVIDSYSAIIL